VADAPSLPELLDAVRAYCAVNEPGLIPSHLAIHFYNAPAPMTLPFGPAIAPVADRSPVANEERGSPLSRCITDILATLREAGRPLTTTRLMEELWKKGREWCERSVQNHLKALMEDGTIENPPDARPRGYRLTDAADPEATS